MRIKKISLLVFIPALIVLATACCPGTGGPLTIAGAKLRIVSVTTQDTQEGKAWLGVKAEIETSDLDDVRGWKVWVVDENGHESALGTVDITCRPSRHRRKSIAH